MSELTNRPPTTVAELERRWEAAGMVVDHPVREGDLVEVAVLRVATSMATARHLTERGMHRMGRCALTECANVYVDDTRGGRQRYCSVACANRDAVRRHRSRRRDLPAARPGDAHP